MVKVSEVDPPTGTLAAPKALIMTGGETTVTVAVLLVAPAPLSLEEIAPVVFALTPAVVPVTLVVSVHELLGGRVEADRLIVDDPATAVGVPPHELVRPLGAATTNPAGRLSVKPTPVSEIVFVPGLAMVKVRETVPFSGTVAAPKALVIVGGAATAMLADAVPPVPPLVEVTLPVVLFLVPFVVPVTF